MAYTKLQLKTINKKLYTAEEWDLLTNYFTYPEGCMAKGMDDATYLSKVKAKANKLNLKEKAINKIGLDEEELQEIPPIEILGWDWDGVVGHTGNYPSKYTVSWLFFSNKEVYLYSYTFDMLSTSTKERCEEYFYKDVVNISTSDNDTEVAFAQKACLGFKTQEVKGVKKTSSLTLVVPGDKLSVPVTLSENSDFEQKVRAAKAKIREKKEH